MTAMTDATNLLEQLGLPRGALRAQTAVVAGAGRPIGRECARALAWLGARVVVVDSNLVLGSETSTLLQQAGGEAIFAQIPDFSPASAAVLTARTHAAYGGVDILVTSLPFTLPPDDRGGDVERATTSESAAAAEIWGVFLPEMIAKQHGVIINVSSHCGPDVIFQQSWDAFVHAQGEVTSLAFIHLEPHQPDGEADLPAPFADDCCASTAAAAACLATRFAPEYHGQSVSAEAVLRRALASLSSR